MDRVLGQSLWHFTRFSTNRFTTGNLNGGWQEFSIDRKQRMRLTIYLDVFWIHVLEKTVGIQVRARGTQVQLQKPIGWWPHQFVSFWKTWWSIFQWSWLCTNLCLRSQQIMHTTFVPKRLSVSISTRHYETRILQLQVSLRWILLLANR